MKPPANAAQDLTDGLAAQCRWHERALAMLLPTADHAGQDGHWEKLSADLPELMDELARLDATAAPLWKAWSQAESPTHGDVENQVQRLSALIQQTQGAVVLVLTRARGHQANLIPLLDDLARARHMHRAYAAATPRVG